MDPNRPHEQATNEVTEFIVDLKNFWDRYGNTLLIVLVIGSLTVFVVSLVRTQRSNAHNAAWTDVANSTSPESFAQIGQDHRLPGVKHYAWLTAADLKVRESLTADADEVEALLKDAELYYNQVLDAADHPVYRVNALEGLGIVAEGRQNRDEAAKRYEALIAYAKDAPGLQGWADRGQARLNGLDDALTPVRFAPSPEPTETETPEAAEAQTEAPEQGETPAAPEAAEPPAE